jgi:exodeoxyribonuclease-3
MAVENTEASGRMGQKLRRIPVKIVTWNVNGIRAVLNKGAAAWWNAQQLDVLCLQEIKAMPEQLTDEQHAQLGNFLPIWNPASRKGYSGVGTFSKQQPLEFRLGLGDDRFDSEGRVIQTCFEKFIVFNVYVPHGGRDYRRLEFKLDFYAALLELCDQIHAEGQYIILTGDFNTAHHPIDLKNPKQNQKTSGFLPVERAWIDCFMEHGFVDIYRNLYPEREEYTWWTYRVNARSRNIGWRLDYFLISAALVERVKDVEVISDVMGSDHCPVVLDIDE